MIMSRDSRVLSQFFIYLQNPYIVHVFEVKESISDIPTELPCLGDFENPGQLPV